MAGRGAGTILISRKAYFAGMLLVMGSLISFGIGQQTRQTLDPGHIAAPASRLTRDALGAARQSSAPARTVPAPLSMTEAQVVPTTLPPVAPAIVAPAIVAPAIVAPAIGTTAIGTTDPTLPIPLASTDTADNGRSGTRTTATVAALVSEGMTSVTVPAAPSTDGTGDLRLVTTASGVTLDGATITVTSGATTVTVSPGGVAISSGGVLLITAP